MSEADPDHQPPEHKRMRQEKPNESITSTDIRTKRRQLKSQEFALRTIGDAVDTQIKILDRLKLKLQEHKDNEDVKEFQSSQMKASNEIKKLSSVLKELESLKTSIDTSSPETTSSICKKIEALQIRVETEIPKITSDFESLGSSLMMTTRGFDTFIDTQEHQTQDNPSSHDSKPDEHLQQDQMMMDKREDDNLKLESEVSAKRSLLSCLENLRKDIIELNQAMVKLASAVFIQRENVNRIECNISQATHDVTEGAIILSKIKKNAGLPLLAAALGTIVAGPVGGILAGKAAAVAAGLSIGTAGYLGGKYVQKITNHPMHLESIEYPSEPFTELNVADQDSK